MIKTLMIWLTICNKFIKKDHKMKILRRYLNKPSIQPNKSKMILKKLKLKMIRKNWHPNNSNWRMMQSLLNRLWVIRVNARTITIHCILWIKRSFNAFHWLLTKMERFRALSCTSLEEMRFRCKIANVFQILKLQQQLQFQRVCQRKE